MSKIGFIGGGNMAEAIIKGIIEGAVYKAEDVLVSDVRPERLGFLAKKYGVKIFGDNAKLAENADTVVLSVKPQFFKDALSGLKTVIGSDKIVISVAAGVTIAGIAELLGNMPIIRVMPNTPALVGEGMSAVYSANASAEAVADTVKMFSAVGRAIVVDSEDKIDMVTAVSGSGPAYYFLMMEEMINAGVSLGLSVADATELVLQTAKGASALAQQADAHGEAPGTLREKVTSPGGTTAAALNTFYDGGLGELVKKAMTAARDRSVELSA